ncbi:MAG: carboxypeptidase-like regulatory domain-containing protein, partial [Candidatus Krumholzibacteria bacterium]|nr:carboxypeptidase-like regulatory domain-containing protein [Candidatus Krumholzibacteria bacterium]
MRLLCAVVFCLLPAFSTAQAASILLLEDPVDPGARYCKSEALRQENLRSGQSALLLEADLLALGHTVLREEIQSSAPETWAAYDLLFFSAGDHPFPLSNPAWRASLRQAVVNGSHLLIEGGDLAYHWLSQDALFNDWVLHADSWQGDEGETLLPVSSHPVATIPHVLPDTLSLAWQSYGDADRVLPAWGAEPVLEWAGNTGEAGVLAYDPDFEPSGGQILFYSFSYEALEETARVLLLENSVNWLLTEVPGSASISGTVTLEGESDHSGTLCRLQPGGLLVWTDSEGAYQFTGLHPNQYELVFLHDGFRSFSRDLELEEGEDSENLNAFLSILLSDEFWNSPELPIPDNDLFGVSDTLTVSLGGLFETLS